ncbi:hypothetical protein [Glaesserella parasuis]|uniref:hypothetical protein n=1 Tax=Glaesserella parasuis TaxID=738 RepID=UPI0013656179|nr:hypothetical protein [Glaesserella parasuis]MDG6480426.1 hypothetical protein [Glaesserella parasuis]MWQ04369.1 hypothetical protein [Glaesserella parasuis]
MSEQVKTQRSSVGLFFTSLFLLLMLSAIGGVAGWFGATTQTAYWKAEAQFEVPKDQLLSAAIGGGIGLLLGFFVVLFINRKKN